MPVSEALASRLASRTRAHLSEPLFRNAYSLMVNSILSASLGLGFWIVAARLYPSEQVGRDSALVAAMMTLSTICQLNLGNAVPRFMPLVANPALALRKLYTVSIGLALVCSAAFVLIAPQVDDELTILNDPALAFAFVAGTSLWGVFALQDAALTGLRQAHWVPVENAIFGILKLLCLPLFLALGVVNGVFVSWLWPMLILLIPVNALIFFFVIPRHRRLNPERTAKLEDINRGRLTRFLAQDFAASALFLGAVALLPLLILSMEGGSQNAYYYIALTVVLALEALVTNAGTSLTVESAFRGERLRELSRLVLKRSLMLMVPCALVLIAAAPLILSPFGQDYVDEATPLLRLFGLGLIFRTFILVFQSVSRSRGRGRPLLLADLCLFILLIGLTIVLTPRMGLEGAGLAWLISNAIIAVAIIPGLLRFVLGHEDGEVAFGLPGGPAVQPEPEAASVMPLVTRQPARPTTGLTSIDPESVGRLPDRRPPLPVLSSGAQLLLVVAGLFCVASLALMAMGVHGGPTTVALVGMMALAPGAALLPFLGARGDGLGLGLVVGTSLAVVVCLAELMVWQLWQPEIAAYGLAAVCLGGILVTLGRRGFVPLSLREALGGDRYAEETRYDDGPLAALLRRGLTQVLILGGVVALWVIGLKTTDLGLMEGYGLLTALGGAWYLALGLLIVGFAFTIWARPRIPGLYGAYLGVLILMLHGSTAFLYDVPRYTWTYKHLGVVEAIIASGGHVDRSLDVYNNWPGFFAAAAWLSEATGVAPIHFAAWAQVFFTATAAAVLLWALKGLAISDRVRWTAVWLYVVADWIGQNYFAPQAMAFTLSLLVLGICLRCAPARADAGDRRFDRWLRRRHSATLRWLAAVRRSTAASTAPSPLPALSAVVVGGLAFMAVVVTHQLSPLLVAAQVIAIVLIGGRVPWWVPAAMAAIEIWWVSKAWSFVDNHFSLFDISPGQQAGGTTDSRNTGLPGVESVYWAPRLLLLGVFVIAAFGAVRLIQQTRGVRPENRRLLDPVPIALAVTPMLVVWLQSYGGEGILRASLFALPWLALLGAEICGPRGGPSRRPARECFRLVGVTALVSALMLTAYFGTEKRNHVTPADVAASTWYETNAPAGSVRAFYAPNAPLALTANYSTKRFYPDPSPALSSLPEYRHHLLGPVDVVRLRAMLLDMGDKSAQRYFIISPSQEAYADLYGLLEPGSAPRLVEALKRSPDFTQVFHDGEAYVFQLVPREAEPGSDSASPPAGV